MYVATVKTVDGKMKTIIQKGKDAVSLLYALTDDDPIEEIRHIRPETIADL